MSFAFAKSSRCLLYFSIAVRDGPDQLLVDGDACTPLVDKACTPVDRTFSSMRSIRISSMDLSTTLRSPNIHARDQISRVGGQSLKVSRMRGEVSISTVRKKLVICGLR
jgi:hypothetical protein